MTLAQIAIVVVVLALAGVELAWRFTGKPQQWAGARKPVLAVATGGLALAAFWLAGKRKQPENTDAARIEPRTYDDDPERRTDTHADDTDLQDSARARGVDARDADASDRANDLDELRARLDKLP